MKKTKVEWYAHGTTFNIKKPGTYWKHGSRFIFTPAPFNCRRIAQKFADTPGLEFSEHARVETSPR